MDKKKRNLLIVGGLAVLLVLVAAIILFFVFRGKDKDDAKKKEVTSTVNDWDNRIADLENEPVSDMDVVYKDVKDVSGNSYLIRVNKSQNCIIIYKGDGNGKYNTPVKAMICSVGYDTPVGEFKTSDKYEWKIVNGNVWAQYATRIVGNVLFHSMPYAVNSKDTLLTRYYNQLGSTLSASCIRLSARDSEWILKNCPAGTQVEIYESENEEPMERPQTIIVPDDAVWDPTDPDPANPYHSVQLSFEGIKSQNRVERGRQINYMDGIEIKDTCGNDLSSQVQVTTNLDPFTLGTYEVKYFVEDAAGKTAEAVASYQVTDTAPPEFSGLKSEMSFSSISDVTEENILKGVSVIDNNEVLENSRIIVVIPAIVEGNNVVTLSVSDDYGNTATATVTVSIYSKPPVISLKPGSETIIPLTQRVDQTFALSRVTAMHNGAVMPADKISVSITPMAWGYSLRYTATDDNGYVGVLNDSVSYVEYKIVPPKNLTVTDIKDKSQLLNGAELKNNLGEKLEVSGIEVTTNNISGNQYQVIYSYTYTSPLGSKTATAETVVTWIGNTPAPTPVPTSQPTASVRPTGTEPPNESEEPDATENANNQQPEIQN